MLTLIYEEIRQLEDCIGRLERELRALAAADPVAGRLREIPGIGRLTATALIGIVGSIHAFGRARQFASWLGLNRANIPAAPTGGSAASANVEMCISGVCSRTGPAQCSMPPIGARKPTSH
jgi:Transposase IS116/IS110/IS902 family